MTEAEALTRVAAYFKGTRVLPKMKPGEGLRACLGCGMSTILVDVHGNPWHRRCKHLSVGITP